MSPPGEGPFTARAVAVILAAGVFALAAFLVLSAYAPELRRGNDGGHHALSKSAVGFAGLVRLLEVRGDAVTVSRNPGEGSGAGLLVATPGPVPTGRLRTALDSYVNRHGEPILLVLPKWRTQPHPRRPGWARKKGLINPQVAVSPMVIFEGVSVGLTRRAGAREVRLQGAREPLRTGLVEALQVLTGQGFQPVLTDGAGGVVLAYVPRRNTWILSDPDLLNTAGLAELATARTALAIVDRARRGAGPVVFDVSLNGIETGRSLLKLAFSPPFLAATLCAAAAVAMAGWQAAVRFGPRAGTGRAVALGAEALADNAAALIRRSGREHRMADRYAALTASRAARAAGAPPGEDSAGFLDALSRRAPGRPLWSALHGQARDARTRPALLAIAQRIHQWKAEVARGE